MKRNVVADLLEKTREPEKEEAVDGWEQEYCMTCCNMQDKDCRYLSNKSPAGCFHIKKVKEIICAEKEKFVTQHAKEIQQFATRETLEDYKKDLSRELNSCQVFTLNRGNLTESVISRAEVKNKLKI